MSASQHQTIEVAVNGDTQYEGIETFFVNPVQRNGSESLWTARGQGTILNDEILIVNSAADEQRRNLRSGGVGDCTLREAIIRPMPP